MAIASRYTQWIPAHGGAGESTLLLCAVLLSSRNDRAAGPGNMEGRATCTTGWYMNEIDNIGTLRLANATLTEVTEPALGVNEFDRSGLEECRQVQGRKANL